MHQNANRIILLVRNSKNESLNYFFSSNYSDKDPINQTIQIDQLLKHPFLSNNLLTYLSSSASKRLGLRSEAG
jgi:hypothetical protein